MELPIQFSGTCNRWPEIGEYLIEILFNVNFLLTALILLIISVLQTSNSVPDLSLQPTSYSKDYETWNTNLELFEFTHCFVWFIGLVALFHHVVELCVDTEYL